MQKHKIKDEAEVKDKGEYEQISDNGRKNSRIGFVGRMLFL
jgi:hypothetical protein